MQTIDVLPSALTYLYGDTLTHLFGGRARLSFSETLPCREAKVKQNDLATAMVTFALVHLVEQDCLRLAMGKTGRIIKRTHVLAERTSTPGGGLGGVEGQILGATLSGTKKNDVPTVVWRLWSSDVPNPVADVIQMGKTYLHGLGYFHEEERRGIGRLLGSKWVPDCDRILALREAATTVQGLVAAFRSRQPDLYGQLWKDVGKGISARQEAPDIDDD